VSNADLGAQIDLFLRSVLRKVRPTRIVTVERKGTALLRTVAESHTGAGDHWVGWDNVFSHDVLSAIPDSALHGGTTLVLDDAVRSGRQAQAVISYLSDDRGIPRSDIVFAAFAVHEDSAVIPDVHWLGQLSEHAYRDVRRAMVRHFQRTGSLLLDTEHIEIPIRTDCPPHELFEALATLGTGITYSSEGGRANLTVHQPLILEERAFVETLPTGTITDSVVRKLRVVSRGGAEYALIPIFFPSIPEAGEDDGLSRIGEPFRSLAGDPIQNFHLVGLYSSIQLLKSAMFALRGLVRDGKVWIENPRPGADDDRISHLKAVLPGIDTDSVHAVVQAAITAGLDGRGALRLLAPSLLEAAPGNSVGAMLAATKQRVLEEALWYSEGIPRTPAAVTFAELLRMASTDPTGTDQALVSAAIDTAVDAGELAAGVDRGLYADDVSRLVRTFTPDNEITRAEVRRTARVSSITRPRPREATVGAT
jgi:hypothetical protein